MVSQTTNIFLVGTVIVRLCFETRYRYAGSTNCTYIDPVERIMSILM